MTIRKHAATNRVVYTWAKMAVIIAVPLLLFSGILAYSYSQIQYSLHDAEIEDITWSPVKASTIATATSNLSTGDYGALATDLIQQIQVGFTLNVTNHSTLPVDIPDLYYGLHINSVDMGSGHCQGGDISLNSGERKMIHCNEVITRSGIESAAASLLETKGMMIVQIDGMAYPQFFGVSLPIPIHDFIKVSLKSQMENYLRQNLLFQ